MAYTKTIWQDGVTAVSAKNLNNIEDGVDDLYTKSVNVDSQIDVLSGLQNGFKIYKSLEDLGLTAGTETMLDIANAMQQNSMLNLYVAGPNNPVAYPTSRYGQLHVVKTHASRVRFDYIINTGKSAFYGFADTTGFKGWESIATTDKIDISFPYASGYSGGSASNTEKIVLTTTGTVFIPLNITPPSNTWGVKTHIVGTLPVGLRPRHGNIVIRRSDNYINNLFVRSSGEIGVEINTTFQGIYYDSIIFNI